MKLSTRARYAMRMMLEVARSASNGQPVSMTVISRGTKISKPYLEQLAIPLKAAFLLKGRAGRTGGYTLGKPAEQIRVREIVEAAIGRINLVECIDAPSLCDRAAECETRVIWGLLNHRMRTMLDEYSLADLSDERFIDGVRTALGDALISPGRSEVVPLSAADCGAVDEAFLRQHRARKKAVLD